MDRTTEKYCVLDFDEFWEACNPIEEEISQRWDEIFLVKNVYDAKFKKKRIESGLQKMLLDEIRLRIKSGLPWLRSAKGSIKPILFLYGTLSESKVPSNSIIKTLDNKMKSSERLLTGYYKVGDVGFDSNGIYVSLDGIGDARFESHYYENQQELLTRMNRLLKIRRFKIENWCNVMISRGKRGFNSDTKYQFFYNMYNPIPNTPSLYGNTSVENFFAALTGVKSTPIIFIDSEYYYATLNFVLPPLVENIDTVGLNNYKTLIVMVNKSFVDKTNKGLDVTETYFDIISVIGTDEKGSNATGCRIILCLALIDHTVPKIIKTQPCLPSALNVQYHKCCLDMYENRYKTIWIAAGKGSGKSKILTLLREKNFIVIDSDTYGRVLYQMAINIENPSLGCPFTEASDPLEFASWIYNFINSSEFDTAPSFHEQLAATFCADRKITVNQLLTNSVKNSDYRDFSYNLSLVTNKLIKVQNFCNLIGYIPSITVNQATDVVPTMIVFGHNTLEIFPAMTNAIWKMEASFDTLTAVISRKRESSVLSQVFLAVYYEKMEPLIANALPTFVIIRALESLPAYNKIRFA